MACPRGENDGRVLKYVTEDEPKRAQPQVERSFEMACPRGEDDGSVLKYVTEDEPKRARQINAYLHLEAYLHLALASSCKVLVG